MKKCYKCGEIKSLDLFHRSEDRKDGRTSRCKSCSNTYKREHAKTNASKLNEYGRLWRSTNKKKSSEYSKKWRSKNPEKVKEQDRRHHLRTEYGLTPDQYDEMVSNQGGRCLVCLEIPMGKRGYSTLHVDHCHLTGRVRGLLCGRCNTALGSLRESEEITQNLVWYIQKHVKETETDAQSSD